MAVGHLEVIDPRFPGVTFAGTAQSVSEQIMALEPEILPDVDVDNMEIAQPRSLHGRSSVILQSFDRLSLEIHTASVVDRSTATGAVPFLGGSLALMASML